MGDEVLARKLITGFLSDVPEQLIVLKDRLEAGDARAVRRQAHNLKGAAATVAAEALRAVCGEVQEAATAGEFSRALFLLPRLEEQFELFRATLQHLGWV